MKTIFLILTVALLTSCKTWPSGLPSISLSAGYQNYSVGLTLGPKPATPTKSKAPDDTK